MKDIWKCN